MCCCLQDSAQTNRRWKGDCEFFCQGMYMEFISVFADVCFDVITYVISFELLPARKDPALTTAVSCSELNDFRGFASYPSGCWVHRLQLQEVFPFPFAPREVFPFPFPRSPNLLCSFSWRFNHVATTCNHLLYLALVSLALVSMAPAWFLHAMSPAPWLLVLGSWPCDAFRRLGANTSHFI